MGVSQRALSWFVGPDGVPGVSGFLLCASLSVSGALAGPLPPVIDLGLLPGAPHAGLLKVYGEDLNDRLGAMQSNGIAFGDVDSDGFDDMIVGAPYATYAPGRSDYAGEVYVIFGSGQLAGTVVDLSNSVNSPRVARRLGRPWDLLGWAVTSSDVNGDGLDDVIVGARNADTDDRGSTGEAFLIFGSPTLPGATLELHSSPELDNVTRVWGSGPGDYLGTSVACGDVNGDGFDDAVLGAPGISQAVPGLRTPGQVFVVYGSETLVGGELDLGEPPGSWGESRIHETVAANRAGWSVAVSDVDNDGRGDVAIDAYAVDPSSREGAGAASVVFGSALSPRLHGGSERLGGGRNHHMDPQHWDWAAYIGMVGGHADAENLARDIQNFPK
jgi:hypothetical protein